MLNKLLKLLAKHLVKEMIKQDYEYKMWLAVEKARIEKQEEYERTHKAEAIRERAIDAFNHPEKYLKEGDIICVPASQHVSFKKYSDLATTNKQKFNKETK